MKQLNKLDLLNKKRNQSQLNNYGTENDLEKVRIDPK
jgi:hypothetical protein